MQRANADLVQAKQAFERANELFKRTLISAAGARRCADGAAVKQASYDSALQNARNLRASIQASEAAMKLAGRQLRDTEIRAPFDGYVERRLVNLGELVKMQMPVMAIVRLDPLKVTAEIPEKMAPWITDGRPVELHVDAYPDRTFTGKVTRISPAVNTATRAFPFEALVPNADAVLKPGTFARVHIESGKVDDVLTLPYAALQYRYGVEPRVRRRRRRLAVRELQVGERLGDRIEVTSGVKAGDRVVVTDVDTLADGALVAVDQVGRPCSAVRTLRPPSGVRDDAGDVARGARHVLVPRPRRRPVPEGGSGDGQRDAVAARREPRRDVDVGGRADGGGDQRRLRASTRFRRASPRAAPRSPSASSSSATSTTPSNDVREKVAGAIGSVPPALLPPVITKVDPDADPVMSLIVSSDAMSLRTLTELADKQIARVIQTVNGVGEVSLTGGRAREIHVVVDIEKLNSYGLSMTQVRDAIVSENVEIPGGTVEQGKGQLLLRTLGRVDAAAGLQQHRRRDQERDADPRRRHRPRRGQLPAADAARVARQNAGGACSTSAAPWGRTRSPSSRACGRKLETIDGRSRRRSRSRRSATTRGSSTRRSRRSRSTSSSARCSPTVVVMFFIRNIRAVIISALAIPASIISSFTLMRIMGFTLNNMTLLGITLAVGIVIDDAIVVLENIFRYIEEKDCSPFEAAIQGTREVALAVMATTLSLVVIFLPIAFMNGYAKRFINPFGWTIAFAILVSMLVSFTLTPMLSSRFLKLSDAAADRKTKERGFFHWLDGGTRGR